MAELWVKSEELAVRDDNHCIAFGLRGIAHHVRQLQVSLGKSLLAQFVMLSIVISGRQVNTVA